MASVPARPVAQDDGRPQLAAFLAVDPYSTEAYDVIPRLRDAVHEVAPGALVGGPSAVERDLREATTDDTKLLVPIALVIVFVDPRRACCGRSSRRCCSSRPSCSASPRRSASGRSSSTSSSASRAAIPALPLFAFIFLVALGVDYNIFLMARVREETLKRGTRARGCCAAWR